VQLEVQEDLGTELAAEPDGRWPLRHEQLEPHLQNPDHLGHPGGAGLGFGQRRVIESKCQSVTHERRA
jgi:hypothetical protein